MQQDASLSAHEDHPLVREAVTATQHWIEKAVIGLNLCPFAKAVQAKGQIRYAVSTADSTEALLQDLIAELLRLQAADPAEIDTTLLIHPWVLVDFLDYVDFLDIADTTLEALGFAGQFQIASFHPHYRFADTEPDDLGNYTNRSPYPTLHLLREASVERAIASIPDASEIYNRNIDTMRRLGVEGWRELAIAGEASRERQKN